MAVYNYNPVHFSFRENNSILQHGNGIHENRRDVQQIKMKPATENTHISLWSRQKSISLTFIFAFNGQNAGRKKIQFCSVNQV